MSELDIKAARELVNGWHGRFFFDEERGDLAYIAKDCDDRQCDCEVKRNADGDQDCAESVEDIDDGLAEVAKMLALVPQLLDRVDELKHEVAVADETGRYLADVRDALAAQRDKLRALLGEVLPLAELWAQRQELPTGETRQRLATIRDELEKL